MPPFPPWEVVLTVTLLRELLIIAILLGLIPWLLMPTYSVPGSAGLVGRGAIFSFIFILVAHLLAMARLYEGLVVLILIAGAVVWRQFYARPVNVRNEIVQRLSMIALEWLDWVTRRRRKPPEPLWELEGTTTTWRSWVRRHGINASLAAIVLGVAAWVRFAEAFAHAAPAYSDAPVTLAWMKFFGQGVLYPDGVYPMGMYGILSGLKKLSFQSDFLVMSAFGPLVGVGLVVTVFLFIRWTTRNTRAAVVGALVYGTLPVLLPSEMARQTGYNSQEFGMLFILPAAWFAYQYLLKGRQWEAIASAAAAGVAIFVHPVSGLMGIVLVAGATAVAVLQRTTSLSRIAYLMAASAVTSCLAILPPVLYLVVIGKGWHGSSFAFLGEGANFPLYLPPWPIWVGTIGALAAPLAVDQPERRQTWMAVGVVITGLLLWILPVLFPVGPLATLSLRLIEAGGFALSIAAGLGWLLVERLLAGRRFGDLLSSMACIGLIITAWVSYPLRPLEPPRISTDDVIEQVLRIDRNLMQGSWMIVMGEPGYALAMGRGTHHYPDWFLTNAHVSSAGWCFDQDGTRLRGQQHVVLVAQQGEPSTPSLLAWIEERRDSLPLTQIAATPDLQVWWLQYEVDKRLAFDRIWGDASTECRLTF